MNPTTELRRLGQCLWLDNITRDLLVGGTLLRYMRDFSVGNLTLYNNPSRPAVLLAGGIGITPFRSMARRAALKSDSNRGVRRLLRNWVSTW